MSDRKLVFEMDYTIPGSNVIQTVCSDVKVDNHASDWEAFLGASVHVQNAFFQYLQDRNAEFLVWRVKNQDGHTVQDNTNVLTVFIKGRKLAPAQDSDI